MRYDVSLDRIEVGVPVTGLPDPTVDVSIYLDNAYQEFVVTADRKLGEVCRYRQPMVIDPETQNAVTETLHGTVLIIAHLEKE